jgi:hypothetical protein
MTATTTHRIPAPRTARPTVHLSGAALKTAIYLEFLYGYGAAPGLDLGSPIEYGKVSTEAGSVYRQSFQRGLTVANLGDEATELVLEHPYYDLSNTLRTSVVLPAHSAEVLLNEAA